MNEKRVLILIDDRVFLEHIFGVIHLLVEEEVAIDVHTPLHLPQDLLLFQLLKHFDEQKFIRLCHEIPSGINYDTVISQWGPPRNFGRRFSGVKRNRLLHENNIQANQFMAFPHGFEIKHQKLGFTYKSQIRSLLLNFSFNPFADYKEFYSKYFFESDFHRERYKGVIADDKAQTIGFPTFNPHMVACIGESIEKAPISSNPLSGNLLIMPKMAHVNDFGKIDFEGMDYVVPHPREFKEQVAYLSGLTENVKILPYLEFFRLSRDITIIDFGTSVGILAQLFGASVNFNSLLTQKLAFQPKDFDRLLDENFFLAGRPSYSEYKKFLTSFFHNSNG